jgi:hypothetical protein
MPHYTNFAALCRALRDHDCALQILTGLPNPPWGYRCRGCGWEASIDGERVAHIGRAGLLTLTGCDLFTAEGREELPRALVNRRQDFRWLDGPEGEDLHAFGPAEAAMQAAQYVPVSSGPTYAASYSVFVRDIREHVRIGHTLHCSDSERLFRYLCLDCEWSARCLIRAPGRESLPAWLQEAFRTHAGREAIPENEDLFGEGLDLALQHLEPPRYVRVDQEPTPPVMEAFDRIARFGSLLEPAPAQGEANAEDPDLMHLFAADSATRELVELFAEPGTTQPMAVRERPLRGEAGPQPAPSVAASLRRLAFHPAGNFAASADREVRRFWTVAEGLRNHRNAHLFPASPRSFVEILGEINRLGRGEPAEETPLASRYQRSDPTETEE